MNKKCLYLFIVLKNYDLFDVYKLKNIKKFSFNYKKILLLQTLHFIKNISIFITGFYLLKNNYFYLSYFLYFSIIVEIFYSKYYLLKNCELEKEKNA